MRGFKKDFDLGEQPHSKRTLSIQDGTPQGHAQSVLSLQRAAGNAQVSAIVGEAERSPLDELAGSPGRPLDATTKSEMEESLGADLADVRVHEGPEASASAKSIQARAYTVGTNIVLGESASRPGTLDGDKTLAHELTHVVQQKAGPVAGTRGPGGVRISNPSDPFEQAAERNADAISASRDQARANNGALALQAETEEDRSGMHPVQREEEDNIEEENEGVN